MFYATISETEADAYSVTLRREVYVTYRGEGWGRSPKIALQRAKEALRQDCIAKAEEYPSGGCPIYGETKVFKGKNKIVDDFS